MSVIMTVPPGDPLGPITQDPEAVRTAACKLVANDATCTTVTLRPSDDGGGAPSAAAAGLDLLTLALWAALIVGLVLVLVVVARGIAQRATRRATDEPEELDDVAAEELGGVVVDRRREPIDWRKEADAHRRAGRWRDALRCRYRALVGDLARRGLIDEIPGRTTGEERAQLHRVASAAAGPFDRAADLFDDAWFGDVAVSDADVETFVELERAVLDATARVAV